MQLLDRLWIGCEVIHAGIWIARGQRVVQIKHVCFTALAVGVHLRIVDEAKDVRVVSISRGIRGARHLRSVADQVSDISSWQGKLADFLSRNVSSNFGLRELDRIRLSGDRHRLGDSSALQAEGNSADFFRKQHNALMRSRGEALLRGGEFVVTGRQAGETEQAFAVALDTAGDTRVHVGESHSGVGHNGAGGIGDGTLNCTAELGESGRGKQETEEKQNRELREANKHLHDSS